ncbi:DHA2 family efflux MFS transporter permease subunit [Bacteroides fragilis]|nr:DHA2 family efflux MFS transporter permease subunit [Bacteroides fragilis]
MKEGSSYKWIVLGNIMIGTFMAVLDSTVVNTGLPVIMGTLGADINVAEWVLTGYMLSMASILPAAGWLSERFGYKKIYFLSLLVFTAGSFMCGSSSTIEELIFWRVIEGFGCGMLLPVGMAIVSDVFPPEQRGTALGFWSIASAASVSFGPTIGGYLVDYMDWNYIFYVNIPIGILALIVTAIVQKEHVKGTKVPFDIPGFITSAIFLPVFMYGLSEVNSSTNSMGWNSPVVLGAMWIAVVTFILFLYFEFTVRTPLINLRLFVDKDFALSNLILFVFGIGMFGSTFLIPLYLQDNLGYSALQAGMFFMPVGIIQGVASPLSGKLMQRINPQSLYCVGHSVDGRQFLYELLPLFPDRKVVYYAESLFARVGYGLAFHSVADSVVGEYP